MKQLTIRTLIIIVFALTLFLIAENRQTRLTDEGVKNVFIKLAKIPRSLLPGSSLFPPAYGINMRSTNYQLQMGDLNMLSGRSTSPGYQMTQTGGDLGPGLYSGNNYRVRSGFQYVMSIIPFTFSITPLTVDFGTLAANTPATISGTLTVSVGSAYGYQVTAFENHPLSVHGTGAKIPDFTGDDGTCTTPIPACTWLTNTTYGFGYNMQGTDVPLDFINSTYYKQFADDSAAESPVAVMAGSNVGRNKQATIKYTVNISATQEAGAYENTVTFTATPSF